MKTTYEDQLLRKRAIAQRGKKSMKTPGRNVMLDMYSGEMGMGLPEKAISKKSKPKKSKSKKDKAKKGKDKTKKEKGKKAKSKKTKSKAKTQKKKPSRRAQTDFDTDAIY